MCEHETANSKESAGAPAKEIEITPAMIEAGEAAVQEVAGDIIPSIGGESRAIATAVYLAMAAARF
jgi:hypothetical protein